MAIPACDILKNEGLGRIGSEATAEVEAVKSRIAEAARRPGGEYIVTDQRRGRLIAEIDSRSGTRQALFDS